MLTQIIVSLTVIITLTLVMSFLLTRVVKQVNKQSKEYFEKKIVVYDDLIDEKQKHLDAIKEEIENTKDVAVSKKVAEGDNGGLVVVNEKLPDYKVEGIFEIAKSIDEKFKIDKTSAVKDFVTSKVRGTNTDSLLLSDLYEKICQNKYNYIAKSHDDGWEEIIKLMDGRTKKIMRPYIMGSPKADINEILSYIKLEIDKASPEVVVETGDKNDNFGAIYDKIRTVYNPSINMGIRIFYQDRMYDYSLRGDV